MMGGSRSKRLERHSIVVRGDRNHTTLEDDNDCCPCPRLNAVHTLVLLLSLTVVFSWVAYCFMEHSVSFHANVNLLRALQARCHALVVSADLTATHASQLLLTHKNFIKGKIKAISSPLAADFIAIYNLPASARNVEIELHSQSHMFDSQPTTAVFHKANTVGQMPFSTIPWEDYFVGYPSPTAVSISDTTGTSQRRTIQSAPSPAAASSFAIPPTPRDRLLADDQIIPAALTARTLKGSTHPYAHLFNSVLTEGDYYLYNHTDKAPCEIHTISLKQDRACRWDSLQGE